MLKTKVTYQHDDLCPSTNGHWNDIFKYTGNVSRPMELPNIKIKSKNRTGQ